MCQYSNISSIGLLSIFFTLVSCFESESIQERLYPPVLLEPKSNQIVLADTSPIQFRWKLDEYGKKMGIYESCTFFLDEESIETINPEKTFFDFVPLDPLLDGTHTWGVAMSCKGGVTFSSESTFVINSPSHPVETPPYIKKHSLDNLQAYIGDYLIVAIEFSKPMQELKLNQSVTIDGGASLSDLESDDQTLYYFKVRNFEWNHLYALTFDSFIKSVVGAPLKQTSLYFRTPKEFPQPKCIGWIGGGKDGWQTENGPLEERDTYYGGLGDREFSDAQDIAFSPDEKTLYIVDPPNSRTQQWTTEGIYQGWIGGGKNGWQYGETPPIVWESPNEAMQNIPSGVCTDIDGNLYIVHQGYNTIHKWDSEGNVVGWLVPNKDGWQGKPYIAPLPPTSYLLADFRPQGRVCINAEHGILFNDIRNIIGKFTKDGVLNACIGCGIDGWQSEIIFPKNWRDTFTTMRFFGWITGIWVDQQGAIFASDRYKQWVIKWSKDGKAIGWIGHGKDGWQTGSIDFSWYGDHDLRSFSYPCHITLDSVGNLFITDYHNHRVSKWTKDGKAVGWIGHGKDGWQTGDAPEYQPDSDGKGNMEYNRIPGAEGIAVDSRGTIYVSGTASYGYNWRVSKWVMDDGEGGGGTPVEE